MRTHKILSQRQKQWLRRHVRQYGTELNIKALEGILYLLRTGCQWRLIPYVYGNWKTLYHLFRSWSERPWFDSILKRLLTEHRTRRGRKSKPTVVVIDSQSVRSGLPRSVKGIDGNKRIKGIKRHILVEHDGLPIDVIITTANVHDSKAAYSLVPIALSKYPSIKIIKADNGYKGKVKDLLNSSLGINMQCVKSNYGTSEFIPLQGRWVVERTIAWLDNFRRLTRNYEQLLCTARAMTRMAFLSIQLKHV